MGSEWETVRLQDVVTKLGDGLHGTPEYTEEGEYYFINGNNLENGKIIFKDKTKRVDHSQYVKHQKELNERTLLVSINGTIGNVAYYGGEKVVLGKSACYFNLVDNIDKKYVRYVLSSHYFIGYLQSFATGTTIKNVSLKSMREFPFSLPSLQEQRAIGHILGSLDDKIELNRQMNETLEAMAQALFKSWFVDFDPVIDHALAAGNPIPDALKAKAEQRQQLRDAEAGRNNAPASAHHVHFPNAFEFREDMGWIPEGWEVKPMLDLIEMIGGGTPKTSIEEYWDGDIPWFSVVDAPNPSNVYIIDTEKHVSQLGVEKSSTKILPIGTTIISARGTVGKCGMVSRPMAMNQSCYGVSGKDGVSDTFTYYSVLLRVADLQQRSHGSVFSTITRDTFKTIQTPYGGVDLTIKIDEIIKPYFDKILENSTQSIVLSKLRDTLLPKLLSGELRIPDAEELIAESIS